MSKAVVLGLAVIGVGGVLIYNMQKARAEKNALPNATIKADEVVLANGTVVRVGGGYTTAFADFDDSGPATVLAALKALPEAVLKALGALDQPAAAGFVKMPYKELTVGGTKYLILANDDKKFQIYTAPAGSKTVFETAL